MSQQFAVGVIGAGVMGEAIISALISYGVSPEQITVSEKREERSRELVERYSIQVAEIKETVANAQVLLLIVKPQDLASVLNEIKASLNQKTLVVSFAAGKKISYISQALGKDNPVIRVMPNTATLVGAGMAAMSTGPHVNEWGATFVSQFLSSTGQVIEVPEDLQDAITATSGSGPAYFFSFVEAMIEGAEALGLSHEIATQLTLQTMFGAAKLLEVSGKTATTLRENVTSPNGTTAAALASFQNDELAKVVARAMQAARDRSQELA